MNRIVLDLQYFTEASAEAAAAPAATESTGSENAAATGTITDAPVQAGDTLPNGVKVPSARVAAELERQMKRHPELRKVYGQTGAQEKGARRAAQQPAQAPQEQAAGDQPQDTIQQRWEAAKKGEFRELYGQDVKRAVDDRFKNQADANEQLNKIMPAINLMMKKAGYDSVDEFVQMVENDDSFYEEEAEREGMTVEKFKQFKALQEEHERRQQQDQQNQEQAFWREHFSRLAQQAEDLKRTFPDFDLQKEMQNDVFRRLTMPGSGVSVEDAYYTIHRKELGPQIMAYGMQKAREQMGQTLQAQRSRPAEGAMRSQGQVAADMKVDFSKMTRKERDEYRRQVHAGKKGGIFA